ncbi:MAG: peptidylprolyl isomerase [Rhodobiaceae bacterium]|nr:MAG: peptidylprolyl isomerase [Rhodobiaceae bacterium]
MNMISINGVEISSTEVAAEVQYHPASSSEAASAEAAGALAIRELFLQEARRLNLTAVPEDDDEGRSETQDDALVRVLLEQELDVPLADEESCRRYFDNNRKRFQTPDIFEARHILISAAPDDKSAYSMAEARVKDIIKSLTSNPALFEKLAKKHSDCPSAETGGNLGQVSKGQTVPEFETFLLSLEEGQLCPVPVKTRYGVHVLQLDRQILGQALPFEAVHKKIASYLEEASWRTAVAQYVRVLAGRADVKGIDLGAVGSPLVQ